MKRLFGVGINDADYTINIWENIGSTGGKQKQRLVWRCPFHTVWKDMLKRCYSSTYQKSHKTYTGCSVCNDWLVFSKFRSWMESQDWNGKQLDKDLLFPGNRIYGPDNCVFVSSQVNSFVIDRAAKRGIWPLGVSLHTQNGNFIAHCSNPFSKKKVHIGVYENPNDAHMAWGATKLRFARELASQQEDSRVGSALVSRYLKYE